MFSSPRSEPLTVLLWGRRWWFPQGDSANFTSLAEAAEVLASRLGNTTLRLIYQPESLKSVVTPCPSGNRATLRTALGFEHPAIASEDTAWGFEPPLSRGDNFETILHFEESPGLFELVHALARKEIHVLSAWPLYTFLHALPTEWPVSGGFAIVAVQFGHALACYHPSSGPRQVLTWHGDTAATEAEQWVLLQQAARPDDTVMLITSDPPATADLQHVRLSDALAQPAVLPRSHPAQLLPPEPLFAPPRVAVAAGVLLLIGAGLAGARYAQHYYAAQTEARDQVIEKSRLVSELEHYRVNRTEILALRSQLAQPGAGLPILEWLEKLCTGLPPTVAFGRIQIEQARFTVTGFVAPGGTEACSAWKSRLSDSRWRFEPETAQPDGRFVLAGSFTP